MSNVKKDNDRRTARLQIDRNSASNGLVTTNKFVSSRNKIIASAASANHHRQQQSNPESLHRYNHSSHGSTNQNPHNRPPPPHHGLLSGSHPMLDRSKHKKQNPEIMKRTLRYLIKRIFVIQFVITHCQCLLITENVLFISWLLDPWRNRSSSIGWHEVRFLRIDCCCWRNVMWISRHTTWHAEF